MLRKSFCFILLLVGILTLGGEAVKSTFHLKLTLKPFKYDGNKVLLIGQKRVVEENWIKDPAN